MFRIRREHVSTPWAESVSIAHLSDLHVAFGSGLLDRLESHLREDPPDVVAMTGDYFDLPRGARLVAEFLREVASRHPVVYVLGNHDRIWGGRPAERFERIPGCHFLSKGAYRAPSGPLSRFEFLDARHPRPAPRPGVERIGLVHDPEILPPSGIPHLRLALAGHLHGGQFVFWKDRRGALYPGSLLYRNLSDRKMLGSTHLVVSRGLADTLPVRLNCPREVVRLRVGGRDG